MAQETVETRTGFAAAGTNERDPQKVTDLIEQLDRDLEETQKNTSKRS